MHSHVALLRGINVGGNKKVAMAALREAVAGLGHADVATYIQSGNVVFSAGEADSTALAKAIEEAVAGRTGVAARVVVLTRDDLARVVADTPYPDEQNPRAVHAVFFDAEPEPDMPARIEAAQQVAAGKGSRDSARLVGRTLFVHTPDGFGRSDLVVALGRGAGPMSARGAGTARNWATVTKLLAMCGGPG